MTPEQVKLVQESWKRVEPIEGVAANLFYDRLFELDEKLRPLFKGNLEEQKKKLMRMIGMVVRGLDNLESIVPAVQALGVRHKGYGVRDADYATVGSALLWTLAQGLQDEFTPDAREAWAAAYTILASTMKAAAAETASEVVP